jgi:hypothetical protein
MVISERSRKQIVLVLRRRPRKPFFPAFANFHKSDRNSERQPILCAPVEHEHEHEEILAKLIYLPGR